MDHNTQNKGKHVLGPRERDSPFREHCAKNMKQSKQKGHQGRSGVNLLIVGYRQDRNVYEQVHVRDSKHEDRIDKG
jgi:hypothetical protein